jgi:putative nucleotidyltransferase with HDIG domain
MTGLQSKFKRFFFIPFDPSDIETNKANITSTLIKIVIFIELIYLIPGVFVRGFNTEIFLLMVSIMIFFGLQFGLLKGYTIQVSRFLLLFCWAFVQLIFLFFENGIRAPAYTAALAFLIVFAGILHGRRGAIFLTAISLLTSLIVIILEFNNIFFTEKIMPEIIWAGFGQLLFFSGITFLVNRNHVNLQKTIQMYQQESHERLQAEIEIRKLNKELTLAYDNTLEGWARALELRDKETEGHSRRVTELSWRLARKLGFDLDDLVWLRHGALLHDIGKMGIPDEILNKPAVLTPEEREIINHHPQIAFNLLKDILYLQKSIEIPFYHHERWDGTGYPKGLKGEQIPLSARIFAVVDVWDALNHDRPYRKAWKQEKALDYLTRNAGSQFDPQVVSVFLSEVLKVK